MNVYKNHITEMCCIGDRIFHEDEVIYVSDSFRENGFTHSIVKIFDSEKNYVGKFYENKIEGHYEHRINLDK